MTLTAQIAVRTAAIVAAVVVPVLVLLPHDSGVEPDRPRIAARQAHATAGLEALPDLFQASPPAATDLNIEDGRPILIGVAGRLPDDAVALVRLPGEPTRTIKVGDTVMAWRLDALASDRATFVRGAEHYVSVLDPAE